jgi:hypothetical protein
MNPVAKGFARLFDGIASIWWLVWRATLIALLTPLVRVGSDRLWGTTLPWWASALIAAVIVLLPWILVWLFG